MKFETTTTPNADDLAIVLQGMRDYELSIMPDLPPESEDIPLAVFACAEDDKIVGGIKANVYWNGLEIEVLWVNDGFRRKGIATKLMEEAEDFARQMGAVVAFLKTGKARAFYESLGYQVYGILEDRPIGSVLYHMKKRLDRGDLE
jgi:GNAT superfamily N-acetyltransferase